jgi:hypothetical protein
MISCATVEALTTTLLDAYETYVDAIIRPLAAP